jgi:hypothetical protein
VPNVVRLTVTDSNGFGKGSYGDYRLISVTADGDPRTRIDLFMRRVPTTPKGKLFDLVLRLIGRRYCGRDLRRTIRQIERLGLCLTQEGVDR